MPKRPKKQINKGNLPRLFEYMCWLKKNHPDSFDDPKYLEVVVYRNLDVFKAVGKEDCANCQASMVEYWYHLDFLNALFLKLLGDIISERLKQGIPFSEANKIHVPSMDKANYAVKSRTNQTSKLGLVAKYKEDKVQVGGMWLITKRGFKALAGAKVPESVKVFRNEIIGYGEKEVTLQEVFRNSDSVYKNKVEDYKVSEWVDIAGIHNGLLF
jgi:hypothetical protein